MYIILISLLLFRLYLYILLKSFLWEKIISNYIEINLAIFWYNLYSFNLCHFSNFEVNKNNRGVNDNYSTFNFVYYINFILLFFKNNNNK